MAKEMLINVSAGEECRIAVVEDGKLEELYMERTSSATHVGNVYKGKVTNVEASIQAAFVDFGIGRNGFLHVSDLMPAYWGGGRGENVKESVGRKLARRDRPPIQHCLRRGDEIIVQVIKEGLGTKGPTLSSYLSIPGRILVMMPGVGKSGVSKKIEDEDERRRLRDILDKLNPPKDAGFIIRTAGVGRSEQEIERDFKYLMRLWDNIAKADTKKAPLELYAEGDLVMRTVRDVYTSDIEKIVVDDKDTAKRIKDFFKLLMPRTKNKVEVYDETVPLFHEYKVERDIEMMNSRTVPLPSGGSLVIDQTEAVVAIDVNSGKSRQSSDAETSAFRTDMEAADEIPRQLKLRDLGGVVICDFIDLRFDRHRRELEARLDENLKKDRAKTRFLAMSEFGVIEMTRQRMRPSLKKSVFQDCPHCGGQGLVKSVESMGLDVVRKLAIAAHDDRVKRVNLSLHPDIAVEVLNRKRSAIAELEEHTGKRLVVEIDNDLAQDEMHFELFDEREGLIWLPELGMEAPQGGGGGRPFQQQGGGRGREGRGGRRDGRNQGRRNEGDEDREEFEERDSGAPAHVARELDDDEEHEEREPNRGDNRDQNRGGQRGGHRDQPRRDESRRDHRRDEPRRDEPRRDEPRRDEPRVAARAPQQQRPPQVEVEDEEGVDEEFAPSEMNEQPTGERAEGEEHGSEGEEREGGEPSGFIDPQDLPPHERPSYQAEGGGFNGGGGGGGPGGEQGAGGGRRRRRRRGRRGRGGSGGGPGFDDRNAGQQQGGPVHAQGGQPFNAPRQGGRQEYTNDPGVETFNDDGTTEPSGRPGPRGDFRGGHQQHGQQGGRRDERGNRDQRGGGGGGQFRGPQGGGNQGGRHGPPQRNRFGPVGDRQPIIPMPPKPPVHEEEDPDAPGPGNSIHEPEPTRVKPGAGPRGRGGRRGRGRGPTPAEKTLARIPVVTPDSLVARFLEEPIDVPETMDGDDAGNRVAAPAPKGRNAPRPPVKEAVVEEVEAPVEEAVEEETASEKPKGRRRGGRGRGKGAAADKKSSRAAAAAPLPAVPKTGSTDAHAVDEEAPDLSEFLKPASPADLDYLPEYEDDE